MLDEEYDRTRERNTALLETSRHLFREARELARIARAARERSAATIAKVRAIIEERAAAVAAKPESLPPFGG